MDKEDDFDENIELDAFLMPSLVEIQFPKQQVGTRPFKIHKITKWCHRNLYICATVLLAGVCGLLFGYQLAIIGGALLQIREQFCLGVLQNEVVASSTVAGALIGSLTGGTLVDYFGRKVSIILDAIVFIIGALVLVVSFDYWLLVLGRLIVGYGISLSATSACVYVSEVAPASIRGMLVAVNQFGISLGIAMAYVISNLFVDVPEGWRYMFGLSIIIAVIQGVGTLFMPRSPRYLLLKGKEELALNTLQKIRGKYTDVGSEFNEMRAAILEGRKYHWWDLFRLKDRMIHRMFIGSGIALFQQLSGQNSILFYAPTLLKTFGFTSNFSATLATISIGTTKFISCIITFFTIDKVGRRPLLIFGTLLLALTMLLLGSLSVIFLDPYLVLATNNSTSGEFSTCYNTSSVSKSTQTEYTFPENATWSSSEQTSITVTKWLSLSILMVYILAYEISFGTIAWLILTEMFPPSVRGQAVSLATTVNWTTNFIVSFTLLSIYNELLGYTYIIYGICCVLAVVFVIVMVPETKGKSLEKISQDLKYKKLC